MIKMVMCINKHPNLSSEAFKDYWLNTHGPHFLKVAKDYRAKKYVQSHTIDTQLNTKMRNIRGMSNGYDGIAEIWWESEDDYLQGLNSPMMKKHRMEFLADEKKFVDLESSTLFFTEEHELI
ncbi:EthD domain-containing protein [uncultured Paraglaciecola sp.]|uniref:EthD domain-containing protein n=1 Tax=uncultured Paraglaciecola sp. TaxID=1765024 RepID=UPI0030D9BC08|tara:strand:+ start:24709 stop:25074 length:366 start_codon:yes stop_codon:yes gene_type:complete